MKKKNFHPSLFYLLFTALFFFGFQQSVDAQFKIRNNTNCTVNLKVGQRVANCSACNPSGIVAIPPGGTWTYAASALCGPQFWLGFKYFTAGAASSGVSYNPGLGGACGADINGLCFNNPITATWYLSSVTGAGPVKVELN